ncbi:MAG: phosphoribosylanthranilate isomerase, partial [Phycisphaerae bacterium]|nr:phosphoribosylanthranilate isomerase [Phycisphaerae bacterium]
MSLRRYRDVALDAAENQLDKVRIKICGLCRPEWAEAAADAGADFVGLVFADDSPRRVTIEEARAVVAAVPEGVTAVGLFVDAPTGEIRHITKALGIGAVQLHGRETPEVIADLADLFVIKAFRLADSEDVKRAHEFLDECEALGSRPDICLADARVAGGPMGGTGKRIPLEVAMAANEAFGPMLLAGGLEPEN